MVLANLCVSRLTHKHWNPNFSSSPQGPLLKLGVVKKKNRSVSQPIVAGLIPGNLQGPWRRGREISLHPRPAICPPTSPLTASLPTHTRAGTHTHTHTHAHPLPTLLINALHRGVRSVGHPSSLRIPSEADLLFYHRAVGDPTISSALY